MGRCNVHERRVLALVFPRHACLDILVPPTHPVKESAMGCYYPSQEVPELTATYA